MEHKSQMPDRVGHDGTGSVANAIDRWKCNEAATRIARKVGVGVDFWAGRRPDSSGNVTLHPLFLGSDAQKTALL